MKISLKELRQLMEKIVSSKHYSPEEAKKIVEVLVYAELVGKNTQGVLKLLGTEPAQDIEPKYKPKVIRETEISTLIDGGGSAGPLSAQIATDKVIEISSKKGFGIVGMNNTFSSVGAIGFYARKIAENNLIGIVAAGSPRAVLHFGGIDPAYGTNPIAFGFPTQNKPITFDMASSAITWYGLVRAKTLGKDLPIGVAVDKEGNDTIDPKAAMNGALMPFDRSYKGSGLGMVVELLTGVLSGANYVFDDGDWGTTFIAISPSLLIDTEEFKKRSSNLIKKVKSGRTKRGQTIKIPGYDSESEMEEKLKEDSIEIEDEILHKLKNL